ncbi:hypothetical protein [Robiginitalea sp. IMCC43444]|uniref:hypothetical protein n=1 Tax=Robiginitalea sp. IMCC43444 TaxID=3459121 RepID=UPI004042266F
MSNFFNELKNRNVYKVATAYVVTSWLILQAVETLGNNLGWPPTIAYWTTLMLIVGFPIALVLTWLYEFTPQGLKRTGIVQQDTADNRKAGRRLNHIIIGVLAVTLCFLLVERVFFAGATSINKKQEASIAVLPFENISVLENSENFAKGLTEQILNDLAKLSALQVIDPKSSFSYDDMKVSDKEIGEELKVNYLLKGSLQYDKNNNRIKVITRLVNANNGHYLWSDSYEGDFIEIFGFQEDVSRNVISQLKVKILPGEDQLLGTVLTTNTEALKLYLESKNYSKKRTDQDLEKAITLLNEAVKLDPYFAEAHAELSYLYGNWFFYGNVSKEIRDERMEFHLDKALALAPERPEVLWAKARYYVVSPEDSSQVIADLRKAIALKPNYSDAYYSLGLALHRARLFAPALKAIEKSVELDPKNSFLKIQLADMNYFYGFQDRGLTIMNELISKDSVPGAMRRMALMLSKGPKGDMSEAYKLIHSSGKHDDVRYRLGNLNFNLLFPLDLDLPPVSDKYNRLMQARYPDNPTTILSICTYYLFTNEFKTLQETLDLWVSEKGLDYQTETLIKVQLLIRLGKYEEAKDIFELTHPNIQEDLIYVDSLKYGSKYNDLKTYIELLRLTHDNTRADNFAKKLCEYYKTLSTSDDYLPPHEKNNLQLDCLYATNDTLAFVEALETRYFQKKDRLDVFSELKRGFFDRFKNDRKFQKVVKRITEETHRMRAEVIEYLKQEGDWDPAWDKELE